MAVYICKMCGAALTVPDGSIECDCEYCGTHQTILFESSENRIKNIKNLLDRGNFLLEDHDWKKASKIFDAALDVDPHCAGAYWGKFLATNQFTVPEILDGSFLHNDEFENLDWGHVTTLNIENTPHVNEMVKQYAVPNFFEENEIRKKYVFEDSYFTLTKDYEKQRDQFQIRMKNNKPFDRALNFADPSLKSEIENCTKVLFTFIENRIKKSIQKDKEKTEEIKNSYWKFESETDCIVQKMSLDAGKKREKIYQNCEAAEKRAETIDDLRIIQDRLASLGDYKDSAARYLRIQTTIDKKRRYIERKKNIDTFIRKNWKMAVLAVFIVWLLITQWIIPNNKYENAKTILQNGQYEQAVVEFKKLGFYRNSYELRKTAETAVSEEKYDRALVLMEKDNYEEAIKIFTSLKTYKDSPEKITECREGILERDYWSASLLMDQEAYSEAIAVFEKLDGYKDSAEKLLAYRNGMKFAEGVKLQEEGALQEALAVFLELGDHPGVDSVKQDLVQQIILQTFGDDPEKVVSGLLSIEQDVLQYVVGNVSPEILASDLEMVQPSAAAELLSRLKALQIAEIMGMLDSSRAEDISEYFSKQTRFRLEHMDTRSGDILVFGAYEQDNDQENGMEPLEWLVLDNDGSRLLMISRTAVEVEPYQRKENHAVSITVTWETCSLRTWLNEDFYTRAFTDDERTLISLSDVPAEANPDGRDDPGNDTKDWIYLLSISEAEKFFPDDESRLCKGNAYLETYGEYAVRARNTCEWWLRTQGKYNSFAATVYPGGGINNTGKQVSPLIEVAVRPVLTIGL